MLILLLCCRGWELLFGSVGAGIGFGLWCFGMLRFRLKFTSSGFETRGCAVRGDAMSMYLCNATVWAEG